MKRRRVENLIKASLKICGVSLLFMALAGCGGAGSDNGLPSIPLPSLPDLSILSAGPSDQASTDDAEGKSAAKTVDIAQLNDAGTLGDRSIGKGNAPVVIIQYTSLACPACATFHNDTLVKLKKAYIDKGKVRFILREYPMGQAAAAAAIAARCVPEKDYYKVVDKYFATQNEWATQDVNKEAIYKVVHSVGLKHDKFDACFTNQSINDALVAVKQRGSQFGVYTAPTLFINGKKMVGAVSFEELQPVIDAALAAAPQPEASTTKPRNTPQTRPKAA